MLRRLMAGMAGVTLLAGCGAPPEPLPTAPPEPRQSGSLFPSGGPSGGLPGSIPPGGLPSGGLPTGALPPGVLPTGGIPPGGLPTVPTLPTTRTPSPTRSTPPPAPVCRSGPSKQQVLDVTKGRPGIPNRPLEVRFGPYCAGNWQFTIVGLVGETADEEEQLLVVTTGRPAALQVVEAGTDVCTDRVEDDAPPGIRVRACGF